MKRFLKTLGLLVVSLFLVVSGVDAALDHLSRSQAQTTFTVYNEQGKAIYVSDGDLNVCRIYPKPAPVAPLFLHRT